VQYISSICGHNICQFISFVTKLEPGQENSVFSDLDLGGCVLNLTDQFDKVILCAKLY
jgi:hypothetical protein